MKTYQHTQPATTILKCLAAMIAIFAMIAIAVRPLIFTVIFLIGMAWIFRSMTVEISDTELIWYFGSGFPRKGVLLSEIASVEVARTSLVNGWGIHYTSRGWLYNVAGYGAVAITLKNGKRFCLGTDEPEELVKQLGGPVREL